MAPYKGFTTVELRKPTRSTFDLSHEKRLSTRIGRLTPIFVTETLPNDTFHGSTEILLKLAPMFAPIFHRLNLYVHYFFVPNRLLWDEWEEFITGGRLGETVQTPPVPPRIVVEQMLALNNNVMDIGSMCDYFGIPPIPDSALAGGTWAGITLDAMPFAAWYQIWYDYYRDRNFYADNDVLPLISGPNNGDNFMSTTWSRLWQHDYFTSALPWTQRGAEVLLPLQGTGTVNYMPSSIFLDTATDAAFAGDNAMGTNASTPTLKNITLPGAVFGSAGRIENIQDVTIDNSEVSINDLRRAVSLQQWLERNALAGSRYNESIMAHFGRKTSDSRLQRAEYLGGGKAVVQISEVMTTAYSADADDVVVPPANPTGRGSTYSDINKFSYNCEEHGFIIGVMSCMPSSSYMQGLPRMFQQRNSFYEYPWPTFAHLGEQELFTNEIYMDPTTMSISRSDQNVFGYQSRYADWKYIPSSTHGDFRTTLEDWHLTRKFAVQPNLNYNFLAFEDELQDRIFNVEGVDTMWCYIYNKINVKRSLPYFGTPML
ncbi:MAG: major capsid protein [Microviridae sp.]|nr:MAG: major capsid protein [Microviridae sp.]